MMDLFSSFNPMTTQMTSMNWMMIMLIPILVFPSMWATHSNMMIMNKLITTKSHTQFKSSMNKINLPNLFMVSSLITFIFYSNIMGMMPSTFSITSHMMINLSLSMTIWLATMMKKTNNLKKLMSNLTPMNTPTMLIPFMILIELSSLMIQPMTLAIRLTANVTAGHIMMILISKMYSMTLVPTLIMNITMMILELTVSLIQAYVFSLLITMYSK